MRRLVTLVLLVSGLGAGARPAESASARDGHFTLEWEAGERYGRPVVQGRIANDYVLLATSVRLRIEALDGTGTVVATTTGHVDRVVGPTRTYFEIPVPVRATDYRVRLADWLWLRPGP